MVKQDVKKDFKIFKEATDVFDDISVTYVVFGGIAVWAYGRKRKTKDIDILIEPNDANKALIGLLKNGWTTTRTDENWLFQARKEGIQVDLIFQAKGNFALTKDILKRAIDMKIEGFWFRVISPEDLVMIKIYASKEIRPADWYDAISVITGIKSKLNWEYIVQKSQKNPKRVLSFLLFVQTEIPSYFVPDWVISHLTKVIMLKSA